MKKSKPLFLILLGIISLTACSQEGINPGDVVDPGETPIPGMKSQQRYSFHPTSEPHINQQLHTLSPLGDIYSVWDYYRGDGVKVAVIDTEFRITHEDFYFSNGKTKITDDSAYLYKSGNNVQIQVGRTQAGIRDEGDWHGTMCAGLLGAAVNKKGTTGIAPNCSLMLLKVDRSPEVIAKAFEYAADNGAKVVSISLGQYPSSSGASYGDIRFPAGFDLTTAFQNSINYAYNKGVTIVSAVGNDFKTTLTYPAGCDNVIGAGGLAVGSMTNLWHEGGEGSNYNGNKVYVDCFAPSAGIYTPGGQSDQGYMDGPNAKGTSFSAPIIAGAAALYFDKYPNATNKDFERDLANSCKDISSFNQNKNTGWGALNIGELLKINEDKKALEFEPSTQILSKGTKLKITNNSSNFKTYHVWGMKFALEYSYMDFENYLYNELGSRILTSNYNVISTASGWAYTDEYFVGDYYIKTANTEFVFPWWVNDFSFQVLDGSSWLPENGGYKLSNIGGKHKSYSVNATNSNVFCSVFSNNFEINMPAVEVDIYEGNKLVASETASVYDLYYPMINSDYFYINSTKDILFIKSVIRKNLNIFK